MSVHKVDENNEPIILSFHEVGGLRADCPLAFFVDESGNTGGNYLDSQQPYYATGGWLFREPELARARGVIEKALAESGMSELKGAQLLRSRRGRSSAQNMIRVLLGFATPLFVIIEKDFALAAQLVDHFVFHPGGPVFPNRPDRQTARELAEVFQKLPSKSKKLGNEFLKARTQDAAIKCIEALTGALNAIGETGLVDTVQTARQAPARWWEVDSGFGRPASPNITGFNTLLQMLEMLALRCGQEIRLTHDELFDLEFTYSSYHRYATGAVPAASAKFFAQIGIPGRIQNVSAPVFCNSKDEPLIQGADVLCGLATHFAGTLANAPRKLTSETRELAVLLLWGFVDRALKPYFIFVGSATAGMKFQRSVLDSLNIVSQ